MQTLVTMYKAETDPDMKVQFALKLDREHNFETKEAREFKAEAAKVEAAKAEAAAAAAPPGGSA